MKQKLLRVTSLLLAVLAAFVVTACELSDELINEGLDILSSALEETSATTVTTTAENTTVTNTEATTSTVSETTAATVATATSPPETTTEAATTVKLWFRTKNLRDQHYEKHGRDMGFDSAESYLDAANDVAHDPSAMHKLSTDGDDVYYIPETNDFVVVSADGYIRTYFWPDAGIDYYNRQ